MFPGHVALMVPGNGGEGEGLLKNLIYCVGAAGCSKKEKKEKEKTKCTKLPVCQKQEAKLKNDQEIAAV